MVVSVDGESIFVGGACWGSRWGLRLAKSCLAAVSLTSPGRCKRQVHGCTGRVQCANGDMAPWGYPFHQSVSSYGILHWSWGAASLERLAGSTRASYNNKQRIITNQIQATAVDCWMLFPGASLGMPRWLVYPSHFCVFLAIGRCSAMTATRATIKLNVNSVPVDVSNSSLCFRFQLCSSVLFPVFVGE